MSVKPKGTESKLEPSLLEAMRLLTDLDERNVSLTEAIAQAEEELAAAGRKVASLKWLREFRGMIAMPRKPRADKGKPRPSKAKPTDGYVHGPSEQPAPAEAATDDDGGPL